MDVYHNDLETFQHHCNSFTRGIDVAKANSFFMSIINSSQCWNICFHLLTSRQSLENEVISFFASKILHTAIKTKWNTIKEEEKSKVVEV